MRKESDVPCHVCKECFAMKTSAKDFSLKLEEGKSENNKNDKWHLKHFTTSLLSSAFECYPEWERKKTQKTKGNDNSKGLFYSFCCVPQTRLILSHWKSSDFYDASAITHSVTLRGKKVCLVTSAFNSLCFSSYFRCKWKDVRHKSRKTRATKICLHCKIKFKFSYAWWAAFCPCHKTMTTWSLNLNLFYFLSLHKI